MSFESLRPVDLRLRAPFGGARIWTAGKENAPPLLLIHGGIGDAVDHWGKLASLVAQELRVFAPVLPGYEGSDPLPSPSWSMLTDWVAAVMDALEIDRAVICGNSFGAATSRAFTSRFPERVTQLFLVNGGIVPPIPRWVGKIANSGLFKPLFALMSAGVYSRSGLRSMIANEAILTDEFVSHAKAQARSFTPLVMSVGAAGPPEFRRTNVPTTLLWGAADKTLPEAKARELAADLEKADVVLFPAAGHMPQVEEPEVFARALLSAIKA